MKRRPGYTLLEVMLAIAIGLLIVAALYVALDVQFRYMQSGRDAAAEGQLARGLLTRMAADIRLHLGTLQDSGSPAAGGAGAGITTGGAAPAGAATAAPATGSTDAAQSGSATSGTNQFCTAIGGDEFQIVLFQSAVPRYGRLDAEIPTGLSDLRQVAYWLEPGVGLARQETRNVMESSFAMPDEPPDILAAEVLDLRFAYYDASTAAWVATWDGSTGPPLAVEINMTIQPPMESTGLTLRPRIPRSYRMVVAVPAATFPQGAAVGLGGLSP